MSSTFRTIPAGCACRPKIRVEPVDDTSVVSIATTPALVMSGAVAESIDQQTKLRRATASVAASSSSSQPVSSSNTSSQDAQSAKASGPESTENLAEQILHPLDPLNAREVGICVAVARRLHPQLEFLTCDLIEPPKDFVLNWKTGDPIPRIGFLALHERSANKCYEMRIDLQTQKQIHFQFIPGVQSKFTASEYRRVEQVLHKSQEFAAALAKRGITDVTKIRADLWSVGWFSDEDDPSRRLTIALCYYKKDDETEEYNYPIEGLAPLVDLNKMEIIRIDDFRVAKLPRNDIGKFGSKYKDAVPQSYHQEKAKQVPEKPLTKSEKKKEEKMAAELITDSMLPLKPLRVIQPEGPSFILEGHHLRWHNWEMRIGFTPREGVVLFQVGIWDKGVLRPVMYRASIAEMVVPYGSPFAPHYRKNAFDVSEDGIGSNLNPLNAGCDCSGEARFLDAHTLDSFGNTVTIPNAICIHEEDGGILWKHTNWRTGQVFVRRNRRLVISCFTTIANYDYGFYWYFGLDGTIEFEILLTGIMSVRTMRGGDKDFGTNVNRNPDMSATYHQHFLCLRLDMMVDGKENSVVEINTESMPAGEDNPYKNAFTASKTLFRSELDAQRLCNQATSRSWSIVNPNKNNRMGYPVSYKLEPGENSQVMMHPDSFIVNRCPFITKHLWVTQYNEKERFPAGDYPAQQRYEKDGLVTWTKSDRNIDNTDICVWYNFGATHIPRPCEWPVMPAHHCGFKLKPFGFFDQNPTLHLPPPKCELAKL